MTPIAESIHSSLTARLSPVHLAAVLAILALSYILYAIQHSCGLLKAKRIHSVPIVSLEDGQDLNAARKAFKTEAPRMMQKGYETQKSPEGFFYVPSPMGERLMIPTKYMDFLKNMADDKADFTGSFVEMFEGHYTSIGNRWDLHPRVIKGSLNAKLDKVIEPVHDEILHAFDVVIPPCDDWTPLSMADNFKRIIAHASSRMMGGLTLSRSEEWIQTAIDFTTDSFIAAQKLKAYPFYIRPIAQYFIPEMASIKRHMKVAQRFIKPLMLQRMENEKKKAENPVDLLQLLYEGARGPDKTAEFLAYTALAVSFAAIHTSASVPAHLIYDLSAKPEYIEPLRKEVEDVFAANGGEWTKNALNSLVRLDSFMKESQRFNPLVFMTFGRVIHKDLTLPNGMTIPARTVVGIPSHAITHDENFYPNAEEFDGFRFLSKDQLGELHSPNASHQPESNFVSTSSSSLSWGYGKHACSGRFFASYEIKMIFAHLLMNYDFKFADERRERPANWAFELQNAPDPTVKISLKRRG